MPIITRAPEPGRLPARMTVKPRFSAVLAGAMSAAMLAGGCGMGGIDGVEMNGGVFEALGLADNGPKREKEPKVAARPGLVLPPDETRLPAPGDKSQIATGSTEAWPVDPETNKERANAALEQRHKEYCDKALQHARLNNDNGPVIGPKGNCRPGLLGSISGMFEGERK